MTNTFMSCDPNRQRLKMIMYLVLTATPRLSRACASGGFLIRRKSCTVTKFLAYGEEYVARLVVHV